LLVLLCLCGTLAGCANPSGGVSPSSLFGKLPRQPQSDDMPRTPRDLKDPVGFHLAYAQLQERVGQLMDARESYDFALSNDPGSVDAVLGLARLDQLAERTDDAEQGFLKALAMQPGDPKVLSSVGQFYLAEKRWDKAVESLNAATLAAPDEPQYGYHLAIALARSGRIDEAMPHLVNAVGDAKAHYNIGYVLYEQGDLAAAEQEFMQAMVSQPDLSEAQVMLNEVRQIRQDEVMFAETTRSKTDSYPGSKSNFRNAAHSWPVRKVGGESVRAGQTTADWADSSNEASLAPSPSVQPPAMPDLSGDDQFALQQIEQRRNQSDLNAR
jgi:tetratricopeptide (TPR) repeat protein